MVCHGDNKDALLPDQTFPDVTTDMAYSVTQRGLFLSLGPYLDFYIQWQQPQNITSSKGSYTNEKSSWKCMPHTYCWLKILQTCICYISQIPLAALHVIRDGGLNSPALNEENLPYSSNICVVLTRVRFQSISPEGILVYPHIAIWLKLHTKLAAKRVKYRYDMESIVLTMIGSHGVYVIVDEWDALWLHNWR